MTLESILPLFNSTEQKVLELLALTWDGVTQTNLVHILSAALGNAPDGRFWTAPKLKPILEKFAHHQLTVSSSPWILERSLARAIVERMLAENRFEPWAKIIEYQLPLGSSWRYYGTTVPGLERSFYFSLYRGNADAALQYWQALSASCRDAMIRFYKPDRELLQTLPMAILDALGQEVFGFAMEEQLPYRLILRELLPTYIRSKQSTELLKLRYAEDCFWRGLHQEIPTLIKGIKRVDPYNQLARLALLQGNNELAMQHINASFRLQNRTISFPAYCNLFQAVILLSVGDKESLQLIKSLAHARFAGEERVNSLFVELGNRLSGNPPKEIGPDHAGSATVGALFEALLLSWLGQKPGPLLQARLVELEKIALEGSYAFLKDELASVLGKAPATRLKSLLNIAEPWKRKLDALTRLHTLFKPEEPAAASKNTSLRLAWFLEWNSTSFQLHFTPKEQKLSNKGWTAGRPIALKRLFSEADVFDYLTDQDRRILKGLRREVYSRGWGYDEVGFVFDPAVALSAMIGHPLLFWADNPVNPVRLERGEPVLKIEATGDKLKLRLDPPAAGSVAVRKISEDSLELIQFSGLHTQLAGVLEGTLEIPKSAEAELKKAIEPLTAGLQVHAAIRGWGAREVEPDSTLYLLLAPLQGGLSLRRQVRPLGAKGPSLIPGKKPVLVVATVDREMLQTERKLKKEQEYWQGLMERCPFLSDSEESQEISDPESCLELLLAVAELGEHVCVEWPAGATPWKVQPVKSSAFQLNIKKEGDWFDASGALSLDAERVIELKELLSLLEGSPGRFLPLGANQFAALTEGFRKQLELLAKISEAHGKRYRFHPLAAGVVEELGQGSMLKTDKAFKEQLARMQQASTLDAPVPPTLQASLRGYQQDGFQWLARLSEWGAGACLADDMGLGKTLQALALLIRRAPGGPALVVAPTSVVIGWLEEARRFAPTLEMLRFGSGNREKQLAGLGAFSVVVCSYGLLQSEIEALADISWNSVVLDEAQAIKNSATQRFKAVTRLKADFRMLCSGTPVENHLGELWSLFSFLNPGLLGTSTAFRSRFQLPIEQNKSSQAKAALQRLIRPFLLRRTKAEVLQELPSRTEIVLTVEPGPEEAAFYEAMRQKAVESLAQNDKNDPGWRIRVLAEITRLRLAACNPRLILQEAEAPESAKLAAFGDLVESLREGGHRTLVFSQFVRHLSLIRAWLEDRQIPYQYLDGSTSAPERARAVRAFQAGEGDLFLISLKAGGTGLNLTAADYVIHMDPWWNPAVEDQASDRAHRIGQLRPVTIYRIVSKGSIEEKIVSLHQHKRELAASLLEGADGQRLSAEELLELLMQQ